MPLLRDLAGAHILSSLSVDNCLRELASTFTAQYDFVRQPLVEIAVRHWVRCVVLVAQVWSLEQFG